MNPETLKTYDDRIRFVDNLLPLETQIIMRAKRRLLPAGFDPSTIDPMFWNWLPRNLKIYKRFVELSLKMRRRKNHYSGWAIIQVLRWDTDLRDGTQFKISNGAIAGLSRLAMASEPGLKGFFRVRDSGGNDENI